FDIKSFGFKTSEDEDGMMESVRSLTQLIDAEIKSGLPANRIVLGGFSQGAAMSLLTGLTSETTLAGVVALSGWLPLKDKFKASLSSHATSVPIFWGHGTSDPLLEISGIGRVFMVKGTCIIRNRMCWKYLNLNNW
ncbi:hypothetical protein MPER_04429, partial [Moniliophthora perniciosa FA553]